MAAPIPSDARVHAFVSEETVFSANSTSDKPESSRRRRQRRAPAVDLPTAAQLWVPSLPGIPNLASHPTHPLNLYAGNLPSYPGIAQGGGEGSIGQDATIFFLMARARRSAGSQRVIFWFNGGPGCSSFDGSLMEVGPFRVVPKAQTTSGQAEVKFVEGGWEEYATMVFIDQPPGVGLSFIPSGNHLTDLHQASAHLIEFMRNFYTVFPDLLGQETYLAGESFAGQYIPYFADAILKTDKLVSADDARKMHLKGVAIGNGWIDPLRQYPAYGEFAYKKNMVKKGTKAGDALDEGLRRCNETLATYTDPLKTPSDIGGDCENLMGLVSAPFADTVNGVAMCLNIYDVRKTDESPACGMNWPPDLADVYEFLRRPDVVRALHAEKHEKAWKECDGSVGGALGKTSTRSPASVHLIPGILEKGVKMLMFAGAEDLICNYVGIERMIESLSWGGETGFGNATAQQWSLNGTQVGEWTTNRNLSYAKIFDASHMVGFDVPHATNDMIMRFMDVDIKLLPGFTASEPSKVGDNEREAVRFGVEPPKAGIPLLKGGKSDWESWYNAVSAVLILLTLAGIVGVYWFVRRRKSFRRGAVSLPQVHDRDREERVPLAEAGDYELDDGIGHRHASRSSRSSSHKGKGKARATESDEEEERQETVFAIEDEDDR